MAKNAKSSPRVKPRQIVGFSLSPETASELKMESARRQLSLRKLLEEMWQLYKDKNKSKSEHGR